jgi:hypothetical protein
VPDGDGYGRLISSSSLKLPKTIRPFDDGMWRELKGPAEESPSLSEGLPYGNEGSSEPIPTLQYQEGVMSME